MRHLQKKVPLNLNSTPVNCYKVKALGLFYHLEIVLFLHICSNHHGNHIQIKDKVF